MSCPRTLIFFLQLNALQSRAKASAVDLLRLKILRATKTELAKTVGHWIVVKPFPGATIKEKIKRDEPMRNI